MMLPRSDWFPPEACSALAVATDLADGLFWISKEVAGEDGFDELFILHASIIEADHGLRGSRDAAEVGPVQVGQGGDASFGTHLKSLFLDFYRGEELPPGSGPGTQPGQAGAQVALKGGLQHIISITEAPGPRRRGNIGREWDQCCVRTGPRSLVCGWRSHRIVWQRQVEGESRLERGRQNDSFPRLRRCRRGCSQGGATELEEIGPAFDFVLRRRLPGDVGRWSAALRRPKLAEERNRQGKGEKKNIETDEMGDTVGRIHMGKQDLDKLQTRKMKGLKRARAAAGADGSDEDEDDDDVADLMGDDDDESRDMEDLTGGADDDDDDDHDDDDEGEEEDGEEGTAPEKKRRR
ncbi:hypothetical protein L7F22_010086 [Adiantum nelumboides]|nr:hypothetical protein [Adiantum nelumboides]